MDTSDDKRRQGAPGPEGESNWGRARGEAQDAADPVRADDDEAVSAEAAPGDDPAGRIEELEAEIAQLKDQQLRALAEAENARRRAQRDREEAQRYGAASLARDLLDVADNLRRALDSVPRERVDQDEGLKSIVEGVEMVEQSLLQAFEKHGISRVEPHGERFDHNYHQAMFEAESTEHPPGHVAQVLQIGYVLHDRLLRPALVGVAKAPANDTADGDAAGGGSAGTDTDTGEPGSRVDTQA